MRSSAEKPVDLVRFRRLWHRWMRTVAFYVRHKHGSPVAPQQYRDLHTQLLTSCQAYRDHGDEGMRPFFQHLEELIRPWVTLESLAHANKPILVNLLRQCQAAEQTLTRRSPVVRWVILAGMLAAGVAAAILAAPTVLESSQGFELSSIVAEGRSLGYRLWFAVSRASVLQKFGVLAAIVVLVGGLMLRTSRSY